MNSCQTAVFQNLSTLCIHSFLHNFSRRRKPKRRLRRSTIRSARVVRKIDYPGSNNRTEFTFDQFGQRAKLIEIVGGTVTSTQQFVWFENKLREERDGSGSVTKKFFARGQETSGTKYFYCKDMLSSVRNVVDNSGNVVETLTFDPFGRPKIILQSVAGDFSFAGYYSHPRSGLLLTLNRQLSSSLGQWLSRDPLEETSSNLYKYAENNPIALVDPLGLWSLEIVWTNVYGTGNYHGDLFLVDDDQNVVGSWSGQSIINGTMVTMIAKPPAVFKMGTHQVLRTGCDRTINDMKARIDNAKASLGFPWSGVYRLFDGANSNTALYSLIKRAGISPPTPDVGPTPGYMDYIYVPNIHRTLY